MWKLSVSITGVAAAEGRADPGEQLVHAEGLGDVVVGVERGDLVGLGVRADRMRMGTLVQPRGPRTTSMPSIPGRPRSRITRSGWWRAARSRACSPVPARSTP
jgi:hypothetical protein